MKIYNLKEEVERDIVDGVLQIDDDVTFNLKDLVIDADIIAHNIKAGDIEARNIEARNIDAKNIDAGNIEAWDINAGDIEAWDIDARNINAGNIDAGNINAGDIKGWNIDAGNIDAGNIKYYAFCIVYDTFSCVSIENRRGNSIHTCLDSEIVFKKEEEEVKDGDSEIIELDGKKYKLIKEES